MCTRFGKFKREISVSLARVAKGQCALASFWVRHSMHTDGLADFHVDRQWGD